MKLPLSITFDQQEHDFLAGEILFLETCLRPVAILDRVAFLELPFERLEHYGIDLPILITTDTACYLRLLDANMSNNGNGFVIAS